MLLSAVAAVQPVRNPSDGPHPLKKEVSVSRSKSANSLSGKQNEYNNDDVTAVVQRRLTRQTQNSQEARQKQASENPIETVLHVYSRINTHVHV